MKYKILENPNYEETYELIEEGLRKKATILLFACCRVSYEGRALSELDYGERIIMMFNFPSLGGLLLIQPAISANPPPAHIYPQKILPKKIEKISISANKIKLPQITLSVAARMITYGE